jgi:hypothetical protein
LNIKFKRKFYLILIFFLLFNFIIIIISIIYIIFYGDLFLRKTKWKRIWIWYIKLFKYCIKQYSYDKNNFYYIISYLIIVKKFAKDPKIFKTLIRAQAKWKGIILRNKIKVLKSGKKKPYLKLNIKSEISEYSDITKNSINNQEKLKSAKPNKQVNIGTPLSNQNQILFSSNSNKIVRIIIIIIF